MTQHNESHKHTLLRGKGHVVTPEATQRGSPWCRGYRRTGRCRQVTQQSLGERPTATYNWAVPTKSGHAGHMHAVTLVDWLTVN
jgi:hypothetical protein